MQYFKVDLDIYLKYDGINKTVSIISKKALQELIIKLVKELPVYPTDDQLLKWAKQNYPGLDSINDQKIRIKELKAEYDLLN
jgi:hypothetical protein